MLCYHCKEQIEVGEAEDLPVVIAEKLRHFHVGHFQLYRQKVSSHYQEQLQLQQSQLG